jgi:glycosyl transferase family 25
MMSRTLSGVSNLKLYVINLDRSTDRMSWFDGQASARALHFIRVPAVDGRDLSETGLEAYHERCPPFRSVSFGELGCFLSHVEVWRRIVAGAEPWAFVAEDDLHLGEDSERFLGSDDWLPPGVDLVKAETILTKVEMSAHALATPFGRSVRLLRSFHGGSAGYFVSEAGAARLLRFAEIHCEPVDHFIFGPSRRPAHGLAIAQIDPAVSIQDDQLAESVGLVSDLNPERENFLNSDPRSRKPRGMRKLLREARRVGGQLRQAARQLVLTPIGTSVFRVVPVVLDGGKLIRRRTRKTV